MALVAPIKRGSLWVPPAPGMIPRLTSINPKVACSAAMRMSQAMAISSPPARQKPLTAAMIGFQILSPRVIPPRPGNFSSRSRLSMAESLASMGIIFFRSAPAEKALSPAPVRIATQRFGSSRKSIQALPSSSLVSGSMEFMASGRLMVIMAILSFFS